MKYDETRMMNLVKASPIMKDHFDALELSDDAWKLGMLFQRFVLRDDLWAQYYEKMPAKEPEVVDTECSKALEDLIQNYGWSAMIKGLEIVAMKRSRDYRKSGFIGDADKWLRAADKIHNVPRRLRDEFDG